MGDYLRIARVYLHGTSAAVWCFMLLCLFFYSAIGEELAIKQGTLIGGVLSRKSYLAMFAYFNACLLGVLLRDNIAHPWASVLPRYRSKHLIATALLSLLFLGIPMLSTELMGKSNIALTSVVTIFLTCLAAGLWTLHHPAMGVLAFPFLIFVMIPASSSPPLEAFLAGSTPTVSSALAITSLLALGAFTWRLVALNEEGHEYALARLWGDLLRGRGGHASQGLLKAKAAQGDLDGSLADQRAALGNFGSLKQWHTNLQLVDDLSGYSERSPWQRLQLWRLGTGPTRSSVSVGCLVVLTLIILPPIVLIQRLAGTENPGRVAVVIMSVQVMTNPFTLWLPWLMRLHRLGYESVRPRTRQEFVRELGLALLWDTIQCWLGGVLCLVIASAIWAPELLQGKNILLVLLGTAVGQLCVYAMMVTCLLKLLKRGMAAGLLCKFGPFLVVASWMLFIVQPIGIELFLAIASALAATSVATIALAYRRWCRADLD